MEPNEPKPVENQIKEENKPIPNKFFNFLEDEAANMQMTPPEPTNNIEELEVLDDFSSPENKAPESPKLDEAVITPFFMSNDTTPQNNVIEEVKDTNEEKIIDPMDSVIKLDPNYNQIVQEAKGIDLKTAINEIRDLISNMEKQGFQISLDEIDLTDKYQMTINIKKND